MLRARALGWIIIAGCSASQLTLLNQHLREADHAAGSRSKDLSKQSNAAAAAGVARAWQGRREAFERLPWLASAAAIRTAHLALVEGGICAAGHALLSSGAGDESKDDHNLAEETCHRAERLPQVCWLRQEQPAHNSTVLGNQRRLLLSSPLSRGTGCRLRS